MKTLYMECNMGIAGDMFMSALLDLFEDKDAVIEELNGLSIPGVEYVLEDKMVNGIHGSHVRVLVDGREELVSDGHSHGGGHSYSGGHSHSGSHSHGSGHSRSGGHSRSDGHGHSGGHSHGGGHSHSHSHSDGHGHSHGSHRSGHSHSHHGDHDYGHSHSHHGAYGYDQSHYGEYGHSHSHHEDHGHSHSHTGMDAITDTINKLEISPTVKENAIAVYQKIAEAESQVHRTELKEIHFHEVGSKDAIADIVGVSYLMDKLGAERIIFSPLTTGYGTVLCAHGALPVPAPATALLLKGIPSQAGNEPGELTTPTGAALAGHFAQEFGQRPLMQIEKIGYGMGNKEYTTINCVRAFLAETNPEEEGEEEA